VTLAGHPLGEPNVRETATGSEVTGPALREWLGATRLVAGERVVIRRVAPDQCRLSPGGGSFRFIDLFAGIGGIRLGLEAVGIMDHRDFVCPSEGLHMESLLQFADLVSDDTAGFRLRRDLVKIGMRSQILQSGS
jgi:hypothetical protein